MTKRDQGLSLLDIAPQCELIEVGDQNLRVTGLSAEGILMLFKRFPELQRWFTGGKPDPQNLVANAPGAIAAVIAAGCGFSDNEDAEAKAASLSVESQLDVIQAVWRLTFKNGFGPFAKRIAEMSAAARSANSGKVLDTKSPPELST